MVLNYGLNKVRFPAPVPVGQPVARQADAGKRSMQSRAGAQLMWDVTVEREGEAKPVCVAEFADAVLSRLAGQ